jgi:hypothetical protein
VTNSSDFLGRNAEVRFDGRSRSLRPSRISRSWTRVKPELPSEVEVAATTTPTLGRDLATVCLLFLLWRGLLFGADLVGRSWTTPYAVTPHNRPATFWEGYIQHDSWHYRYIIREGYRVETEGRWKGLSTNAAFFPLYPYAVKALIAIPGYGKLFWTLFPAGLILSNVTLVLALAYMLRIARLGLDEDGARRSLTYLLAYPTSFFFSSFYTEGLFLLTATASCYHFLGGRYARSGVWGFLAAMTRSPGVMLLPAFLLGHVWERRGRLERSDMRLLWLGLIPCGLATVMTILYLKVGDPLAFSKAQIAWSRSFTLPHRTLWNTLTSMSRDILVPGNIGQIGATIDLVSSIVFLALPLLLLRSFHKALALYTLLLVLMPLSTGTVTSMTRYQLVAFPGFFALARLGENRSVDRLIVFGSGLLLALMKVGFSNSYPIF